MDNKFEINVDFLAYFRSKGKVEAGDFYESKNIFSVFDKNHDGELDNNEISSIFKQIIKHSDKNNNDTRADAFAIFDDVEAKSFVNETKNKDGKTFAELGISISELFNFLKTLSTKAVEEPEELEAGSNGTKISKEETNEEDTEIELTNEQKQIAKKLADIPERKEQQFTEQECALLARLTKEELEEAKKFFYIEGRHQQFTALDICQAVEGLREKFDISPKILSRFSEFANIKDKNGNELNAADIMHILAFNDKDKINKAKTLLTQSEKQFNDMTTNDVTFIIKSNSSYLYNLALKNPDLQLDRQEMIVFGSNSDIRECKLDGKTYRFIIGQELPEEVTLQQVGKDLIETVHNPNLNVTQIITYENSSIQTAIKNPSKIETRHLDANGNTEYTEVCENGGIAGTSNIYTIDKNGNKTYIQTSSADKDTGIQKFSKNFVSSNGIKTNFELTSNPETNEYELNYQITNPEGKEPQILYSKKQSLKKTGEKTFLYTKDGKTYNLSISNDNMMSITNNENNQTHTIDLNKLFPDQNAKFISNRLVKMPAEMLVYLANHPLNEINIGEFKDDNGHFDKHRYLIELGDQTIPKSETEMEDTVFSILMHEFGHCLDFTMGENPDIFSTNPEFAACFKEEVDEFKRNHTSAEQNFAGYFTGATTMEGITRGQQETVAEINMLTNTVSKEVTSTRAYLLQRYFPKTIAFVAKMIQERLQQ